MTESEKDAQARWIIKQDEPVCTCKPTNPKHVAGWYCVSKDQLTVWAAHESCYFTNPNDRKRACWMWWNWSQHPVAKEARHAANPLTITTPGPAFRSSSASAILGFDRWDDDAGMTELQKGMFP